VSFKIDWSKSARRSLYRLPTEVAIAISDFVAGPLAEDPHRVGKPLRDLLPGSYSARVGVYRIIYEIDDVVQVVSVERIGHRADIYRPY
jgi:mRNA interferase RelE/StbE